jgi:hypothetical protein
MEAQDDQFCQSFLHHIMRHYQGIRLFFGIITNFNRLIFAFFGNKNQKTSKEKIQYLFAVGILSLLIVYLVVLGIAVVNTIQQIPQVQEITSIYSDDLGSTEESSEATTTTSNNQKSKQSNAITISQVIIIAIAVIDVFYPNLKQSFTDAAVDYICLIEYFSMGSRHQTLGGQLTALIDHVASGEYRHLHLVGFSFGTIIAIDNLYPSLRVPVERYKRIHTLVTIGCPYDLIRVFWPKYFDGREAIENVPKAWINIYSPIDVMGSNFSNRPGVQEPNFEKAVDLRKGGEKIQPSHSFPYVKGRPKEKLSFFNLITLVGLQAHTTYWEKEFESEDTAYTIIIKQMYTGDFTLS